MDFINELNARKEIYENELIMAQAKVCVINELISDFEAATRREVEEQEQTELAHIDETY